MLHRGPRYRLGILKRQRVPRVHGPDLSLGMAPQPFQQPRPRTQAKRCLRRYPRQPQRPAVRRPNRKRRPPALQRGRADLKCPAPATGAHLKVAFLGVVALVQLDALA